MSKSPEVRGISAEEWSKVWHVYDAAMAAYEAMNECLGLPNDAQVGMHYECMLSELWAACCTAEGAEYE